MANVILYLTTVVGGETVLLCGGWSHGHHITTSSAHCAASKEAYTIVDAATAGAVPRADATELQLCAGDMLVHARAGNVAVWRSFLGGVQTPLALHTALPVREGEKLALCLPIVRDFV